MVDASVVVAALTDSGAHGRWAEEILAQGFRVAPQLILVEVLNILRRLERAGRLSEAEARRAQQDLLALDLELFPLDPLAERIWQLRANLTAYDAWYVALAEALDAPLATLDHRLAASPGPVYTWRLPPDR